MVKIHEIAHLLRQVAPLLRVHHHVLTALAVVVLHRDVLLRVLVVDIGLGDAQFLFHAKLDGKSMGVPSRLTVNLIALHRLITVEGILDGAGQHMVNARMAVCRGRSLIEYKLRTSLTFLDALMEYVLGIPLLQYLLVGCVQVKAVMFGKFLGHFLYF